MWIWLAGCALDPTPTLSTRVEEIEETPAQITPGEIEQPGRSGVMVPSQWPKLAWIADTDNGSVLLADVLEGVVDEVEVGAEPARLVRWGDRLWVTLRGEGRVAELRWEDGAPRLTRRQDVGAEPFDLALSPDGSRLWVSLSMQDEVVGLDPETLQVVERHRVEGEPRWLAVLDDPVTGESILAVVPLRGARVQLIGPQGPRSLPFPPARRSPTPGCEDVLLVPRATGEPVWDAELGSLWVPGLYVDTEMSATPAGDPGPPLRCPVDAPEDEPPPENPGFHYGSASARSIGRFNAVVVRFDLVADGRATPWLLGSNTMMMMGFLPARSAPVALDLLPSGRSLNVAVEGEPSVIELPLSDQEATRVVDFLAPRTFGWTADGGVMSIRQISLDGPLISFAWSPLKRSVSGRGQGPITWLGASEIPADAFLGRQLFFLQGDPEVADPALGVTCASCHAEGRADGLTWRFPDLHRQTPSLAGGISETAPFTWTADVPTVADEAKLTSELRMGGTGMSAEKVGRLVSFIDWTRGVQLPEPSEAERALIRQGEEVFHRPEVGCATCHDGPRGTVDHPVPLRGLQAISVPALTGIAATAPYFHDGSAPTLRAVLERSRDASMGDTSSLDDGEMRALETFLRFFGR